MSDVRLADGVRGVERIDSGVTRAVTVSMSVIPSYLEIVTVSKSAVLPSRLQIHLLLSGSRV